MAKMKKSKSKPAEKSVSSGEKKSTESASRKTKGAGPALAERSKDARR